MADVPGSLRREALHAAIQERVKHYIIERGLRPGDPLPAEPELARSLGISRPSLREAMRALQTLGVVEVRRGAGTFVGRFSLEPFTEGLTFQIRTEQRQDARGITRDLRELVAIREVLESGLVARLAGTYPPEDISALYLLVEEMERRAAAGQMFPDQDWAFHERLYLPTGNRLLLQLLQAFWAVFDRVREQTPPPAYLQSTARHHREIVDALAAGDGPAAARAMATHFSGILAWIHEQGAQAGPAGAEATARGSAP